VVIKQGPIIKQSIWRYALKIFVQIPMTTPPLQTCEQAVAELHALGEPAKAKLLAGFFKTGKGQYGEGDRFLGVVVPTIRRLTKRFSALSLAECKKMLASPYNEARLLALLILVAQYSKGTEATQEKIYQFYLAQRQHVNNWNLVDSSAPYIAGAHLLQRDRAVLYELVQSSTLWDRRIAVLATFAFIRAKDFTDTLQLTLQLLDDKEDLMHKACGWMLREVGKRSPSTLHTFLAQHHSRMPRTMLRYAIERFTPAQRSAYLRGASLHELAA
jgi:3-methyladenine DNA glycosylase AlkD